MPVPFEFVVDGPVVSQQARRGGLRDRWRNKVRRAAQDQWKSDSLDPRPVSVAITYFFNRVDVDVDNIPKPILDALKGLVYRDDKQVSDLFCRKRNYRDVLRIPDPPADLFEYIREQQPVVHVIVDHAPSEEVTF